VNLLVCITHTRANFHTGACVLPPHIPHIDRKSANYIHEAVSFDATSQCTISNEWNSRLLVLEAAKTQVSHQHLRSARRYFKSEYENNHGEAWWW
jgi:hypothetical protein